MICHFTYASNLFGRRKVSNFWCKYYLCKCLMRNFFQIAYHKHSKIVLLVLNSAHIVFIPKLLFIQKISKPIHTASCSGVHTAIFSGFWIHSHWHLGTSKNDLVCVRIQCLYFRPTYESGISIECYLYMDLGPIKSV